MNRRRGFTLLEICLAVTIIIMLVLIAVPSITGALAEQRLQATFQKFDLLVRKAQARSVDERRTYQLAWKKDAIELIPFDLREGETPPEPESLARAEGESYGLQRPAAMSKEPPPNWTFWRSGVCEPAIVKYSGPSGSWVVKYDPLTAHGTFLSEEVR